VSDAGPDQAVSTNGLVQLDGGASFDANSDSITYSWSLTDSPTFSTAVLSDSSVVDPTFVANVAGSYVAQLIVTDVHGSGSTDTVEIFATAASSNILPVADAGADQTTVPDEFVVLDGSASFDGNNDPLVFHWLLIEIPAASAASVSDPGAEYPIFFADVSGRYVAQLVVSDAVGNSPPDTVEIIARDPSVSTFFVIPLPDGGAAVFDL
jgi:hypothetical protein